MRRVLRWSVPVDDQWHRIEFVGDVASVGCRDASAVEFWTSEAVMERRVFDGLGQVVTPTRYEPATTDVRAWEFRVFGTGHPIEDGRYIGTAASPNGVFVWHLFGREVPA